MSQAATNLPTASMANMQGLAHGRALERISLYVDGRSKRTWLVTKWNVDLAKVSIQMLALKREGHRIALVGHASGFSMILGRV